jgi:hypothetical protein
MRGVLKAYGVSDRTVWVETEQERIELVSRGSRPGPMVAESVPHRPATRIVARRASGDAGRHGRGPAGTVADAVPFRAPGLIGYSCPHIVERRGIRQVDAAPWLAAGAIGFFSDDPLYLSGRSPLLTCDPFRQRTYYHGHLASSIAGDRGTLWAPQEHRLSP